MTKQNIDLHVEFNHKYKYNTFIYPCRMIATISDRNPLIEVCNPLILRRFAKKTIGVIFNLTDLAKTRVKKVLAYSLAKPLVTPIRSIINNILFLVSEEAFRLFLAQKSY